MIFTGLKDENGNIIPVQGAGTVYDEQKNSLALGKGTSAIGQDQLVFGRVNTEDNNKAEIVGGGASILYNPKYRYYDYVSQYGYTFCAYKVGETKEEVERYLSAVRGASVTIQNWNSNIKSVYRYQYNPGVCMLVNVSSKDLNDGDNTYLLDVNSNTPSFSGNPSPITMNDVRMMDPGTDYYYYEFYKLYEAPEYLKGEITILPKDHKNIRTLDWQGNQWNAGDVTCDDEEHENVLSLRETAAKADELETSKADAVHHHDGIAASSGSGQTIKQASVIAEMDGNDNPRVRIRVAPSRDLHYDANIDASSIANLKRALAEPDATPTEDSNNLMTSGAIYTALAALEARIAALETAQAE